MCSPFLTFLLFFIMKFVFLLFPHICLINYQICNRILTNQKYELFCIYLFRNLVRYFFIKLAKAGFTSDKVIVFTTSINLFELNPFAKNCFIVLQNVLLSLTFLTQRFCKMPLFLKGFFYKCSQRSFAIFYNFSVSSFVKIVSDLKQRMIDLLNYFVI